MTDDLLERLYDGVRFNTANHEYDTDAADADMEEGAKRIKALTAERDQAWKMVAEADTRLGQALGEAIQDKADNARLREAIEAMNQAHCKADLIHRGKVWRDVMKLINAALNTGKKPSHE